MFRLTELKLMKLLSFNHIRSIKAKLILIFILLVILPMSLSTGIGYYKSSAALNLQTSKSILLLMKQLNRNINSFIEQMDKFTMLPLMDYNYMGNEVQRILKNTSTVTEEERIKNEYKLREFFLNLKFMNSYIDNILIYANDSNIYSFYEGDPIDTEFRNRKWYISTIEANGKKVLTGTHNKDEKDPASKQIFSLSKRLNDFTTRRSMGVIVINANISSIANICREIDLGKDSNVIIASEDGSIILNNNGKYFFDKIGEGNLDEVLSGESGETIRKINNDDVLVTWYTSEYTGWKLIGLVPVREIHKDIILIRNNTILIMSLFFVITLIIFSSISSGIINPLNRLRNLMKKAESGDFDVSIQIDSRDEIRQLGNSFNIMIAKIKELVRKVYQTELAKKQAELNALQSQINPHYLYNTLESIRMMAALNEDTDVMNMITILGDTFRYNINISNEIVTIEEEIKHVNNYLAIQKMRYQDRLEVFIHIDESILQCKILKLVIQPIVENSIYHGLGNKTGIGHIRVIGSSEDDRIKIEIIDDGTGMTSEQLNELLEVLNSNKSTNNKRSIGLSNIHERLRLFFGENYRLEITSSPDTGTHVVLSIPIVI